MDWVHKLDSLWTVDHVTRVFFFEANEKVSLISKWFWRFSTEERGWILCFLYRSCTLNRFLYAFCVKYDRIFAAGVLLLSLAASGVLLPKYTKSLCVLALQNSQFEASTSSRPQTVNFEALGHKAILVAQSCGYLVNQMVRKGEAFLLLYFDGRRENQSGCFVSLTIILSKPFQNMSRHSKKPLCFTFFE